MGNHHRDRDPEVSAGSTVRDDRKYFFDPREPSFVGNLEYHFTPVMEAENTPDEEVRYMLEGWAEFYAEEGDESAQTREELLDAYDAFVSHAVEHAITIGRHLHEAIHKARTT